MKHLQGKTIYLVGSYNFRRSSMLAAQCVRVAKVFVTIKIHNYEEKFRFSEKSNWLTTANGAKVHMYFETMQAADDYITGVKLSKRIYEKARLPSVIQKLPFETICKLAELLGVRHE